jgi:hypothetical protein
MEEMSRQEGSQEFDLARKTVRNTLRFFMLTSPRLGLHFG